MIGTILVVDDNQETIDMATAILSPDFIVIGTNSLAECFASVASRAPDAILLDLGLPDSQGLATVREMREHYPGIPIVTITGSHELCEPSIMEGAQDSLPKSMFSPHDMRRVVWHSIVRHRVRGKYEEAKKNNDEMQNLVAEVKSKMRIAGVEK